MKRAAVTILALSLASGCQDDAADVDAWKDDYSFVHEGEHVTVYGYELSEGEACAGSFDALDVHTRSVMDLFGVDESARFDYRWMSGEFWPGRCPTDAGACAVYGVPHTRALPDMHEAVHMVAYQSPNHGCASLLEEGLAEYLGAPSFADQIPAGYTARDLMTIEENPGARGYARAAHFVSFLIETYGTDGFVRLCSAIPYGGSLATWEAGVQRALGTSLDELLSEYERYPLCSSQQLRARQWECGGDPDFVFSPDDRVYEIQAGCDDPSAMNAGIYRDPGDAVLIRRVYLPADAWVQVLAYSPHDTGNHAIYMTQECAPCSADPQIFRYGEHSGKHTFRAGMHEVIVFFDKHDTVRLRMIVLGFH